MRDEVVTQVVAMEVVSVGGAGGGSGHKFICSVIEYMNGVLVTKLIFVVLVDLMLEIVGERTNRDLQ